MATLTRKCPDGCFELTYTGHHAAPEVDDREHILETAVPDDRPDRCPNCGDVIEEVWA